MTEQHGDGCICEHCEETLTDAPAIDELDVIKKRYLELFDEWMHARIEIPIIDEERVRIEKIQPPGRLEKWIIVRER